VESLMAPHCVISQGPWGCPSIVVFSRLAIGAGSFPSNDNSLMRQRHFAR
jgi:hypothetical protein